MAVGLDFITSSFFCVHCYYTWDQIIITLATRLLVLVEACHFPPSAKVGPFSRWAPPSSMKGLLITHMVDFLPPACCCAKYDPFTTHSPSTCFTCQLCSQPENSLLLIFAAWHEWNLLWCLCFCCTVVVAGSSKKHLRLRQTPLHPGPQHIHPIPQPSPHPLCLPPCHEF